MVLRIRLARFGQRHKPIYNIVVAQARSARDSKPLEVLGVYDPLPKPIPPGDSLAQSGSTSHNTSNTITTKKNMYKDIRLDVPRARYWLGVGAQPSETVARLLGMLGLVEERFHVREMRARREAARAGSGEAAIGDDASGGGSDAGTHSSANARVE